MLCYTLLTSPTTWCPRTKTLLCSDSEFSQHMVRGCHWLPGKVAALPCVAGGGILSGKATEPSGQKPGPPMFPPCLGGAFHFAKLAAP